MALREQPPPSLKWYLWAQLVSLPIIWLSSRIWGIWSPWYGGIYVAATLPILWSIGKLCWESLADHRYKLRAIAGPFLIAGVLGRLAYLGLSRQATYFDWINLSFGVCLAWSGTTLGFSSPHQKRWDLALILAVFWMTQAVSSFGWTLFLDEKLNWQVDPILGIAAFLLISWRLRMPHPTPAASQLP